MIFVVGAANQRASILYALKRVEHSKEIREVLSAVAMLRLSVLEQFELDLIIVPWRLEADIDGFEFLKILRQIGLDVPVCLVVVNLDQERQDLVAAQSNASIVDWKHIEEKLRSLLAPKPST